MIFSVRGVVLLAFSGGRAIDSLLGRTAGQNKKGVQGWGVRHLEWVGEEESNREYEVRTARYGG